MYVVAMRIAEYLEFNVMRAKNVAFNQNIIVAECIFCFAACRFKLCCKIFGVLDEAHAFAATASHRLDQLWKANFR